MPQQMAKAGTAASDKEFGKQDSVMPQYDEINSVEAEAIKLADAPPQNLNDALVSSTAIWGRDTALNGVPHPDGSGTAASASEISIAEAHEMSLASGDGRRRRLS